MSNLLFMPRLAISSKEALPINKPVCRFSEANLSQLHRANFGPSIAHTN